MYVFGGIHACQASDKPNAPTSPAASPSPTCDSASDPGEERREQECEALAQSLLGAGPGGARGGVRDLLQELLQGRGVPRRRHHRVLSVQARRKHRGKFCRLVVGVRGGAWDRAVRV